MKNFFIYFFIIISSLCVSQNNINPNELKIKSIFQNYFTLNREAIHLHLNKSTFLNEENVWFKGYVISRNNSNPNSTTNIYILLLDENGNKITEQLVFANNGVFTGNIPLNVDLVSGKYYIQAYTNWMNNFNENESTITQIDIINPKQGYKNYDKINFETLSIDINPEGGKLIKNINNTLGIQAFDCQNNSPKNLEGKIVNDKNEIVKTFKLNQFGLGKVELLPTTDNLKLIINTPNGEIAKDLPKQENIGFGLEVNSFSFENKTVIKIKSNSETLKENENIFLVINQDEKTIVEEVSFNTNCEKTIFFEHKNIFNGIINIRLLDKNLNQLAERLAYIPTKLTRDYDISDKSITINNLNQGNISVSILPQNTKSNDKKTPIIVGLKINPYLVNPLKNANYYFTDTNRQKEYELDLVLLNQKETKYNWNYIKLNSPKEVYSFDYGLTLKGKVETGILKNRKYKIKMHSLTNLISELADVNEFGEFTFENLVIADSTQVELLLMEMPKLEIKDSKTIANIINFKKPFYKSLKFIKNDNCETIAEYTKLDIPILKSNIVPLNEVILKNKFQKEKLKHENDFGNFSLRSFKIDNTYRSVTLLTFIARNGFIVSQNTPIVTIRARTSSMVNSSSMRSEENFNTVKYISSNRSSGPEIWVDDRIIINTDEIKYLNMDEIDEIFLNPNFNPIGMNNNQGIIKIYLKKPHLRIKQKETQKIVIKEGFSKITQYKELNYSSKLNSAFESYGILDWKPNFISNENNEIKISTNNFNKVIVEIEGISSSGEIIQQNLLIE